jgi:predicted amidophosphoribosyltransferase
MDKSDYGECTRCGKKLHRIDCPQGKLPISHDMDGGVYAPRWYFILRPETAQTFIGNISS